MKQELHRVIFTIPDSLFQQINNFYENQTRYFTKSEMFRKALHDFLINEKDKYEPRYDIDIIATNLGPKEKIR